VPRSCWLPTPTSRKPRDVGHPRFTVVDTKDLVDAGKIQCLGQRIRSHAHRFHELGLEDFSGMDGEELFDLGMIDLSPIRNRLLLL